MSEDVEKAVVSKESEIPLVVGDPSMSEHPSARGSVVGDPVVGDPVVGGSVGSDPISSENEGKPVWSLGPLLALGGVALAGVAGLVGGPPLVLIFLAACMLTLTIALVWNSLNKMGDGARLDFEDALELAAPTATEEQKLSVLRALKDLEYELSVGKISKQDFEVASAEYRAEARRLIAAQDESMKAQIEAAEAVIEKHLEKAKTSGKSSKRSPKSEKRLQSKAERAASKEQQSAAREARASEAAQQAEEKEDAPKSETAAL